MTDRIRSTNVRFNLDKEIPAQAWQYLQTMDRQEFKSYSQVIAAALVDYFDRYYKNRDDPYLETREREEQFAQQIISAVEKSMEKALPVFASIVSQSYSLFKLFSEKQKKVNRGPDGLTPDAGRAYLFIRENAAAARSQPISSPSMSSSPETST